MRLRQTDPWRELAEELRDTELDARRGLPDLRSIGAFPASRWRALRTLGFEAPPENLGLGTSAKEELRAGRLVLRAKPPKAPRLVEVRVGDAEVVLDGDLLRVSGRWADATEERALLDAALDVLGLNPELHVPGTQALAVALAQGFAKPGKRRCVLCRRGLDRSGDFVRAQLVWTDGTSRILFGDAHLRCAHEEVAALLGAAIAAVPPERRADALAPFATADSKITRGAKLVRCAHCRKPIAKTAWRLEAEHGPSPLHVECAKEKVPDLLAIAEGHAPEGYAAGS